MTVEKTDIQSLDDVKLLVNTFYGYIQKEELLGPIFNGIIQGRWAEHLEKIYRFWQTILLEEHTYKGSPFAPHASMPLEQHHFERWLGIFFGTVDQLFVGEKAEEAKWRAQKMATMFNYKIEYFRNKGSKGLV